MPTRRDRPYRAVVAVARFLFRVLGLRVEVRGAEHLPATGPVVVAANHQSFADFAVVGLPAVQRGRLVRFLAKEAVFRAPVAGWLMRAMGHVPVDRRAGAAAAVRALRLLRAVEGLVDRYPDPPRDPVSAWWWPATRGDGAPDAADAARLDRAAMDEADDHAARRRARQR